MVSCMIDGRVEYIFGMDGFKGLIPDSVYEAFMQLYVSRENALLRECTTLRDELLGARQGEKELRAEIQKLQDERAALITERNRYMDKYVEESRRLDNIRRYVDGYYSSNV